MKKTYGKATTSAIYMFELEGKRENQKNRTHETVKIKAPRGAMVVTNDTTARKFFTFVFLILCHTFCGGSPYSLPSFVYTPTRSKWHELEIGQRWGKREKAKGGLMRKTMPLQTIPFRFV